MQRRTLLKLSATAGAAVALAGGGVALFYEPAWRGGALTAHGRAVLGAVGRAVLEGSLPADPDLQRAALVSHLDRMNATLRALPPASQREVAELLAVLATRPGRFALAGLTTDWRRADVAQVADALQAMRTSRLALRQRAYHALRDLTHAAYFADSATWVQLGYPGPTKLE